MGNREDLLAGARKVIFERGVAKATARDIAGAAGVSLAAIGYHFGSKEQLITEALTQSLGTGIGDRMDAALRETAALPPLDAFAAVWNAMPAAFAENREALIASLENVVRMLRSPEASQEYAGAMSEAYSGTAAQLRETRPELDDAQAEAVAKLYFALAQSLGILWLVTPEAVPTGEELAAAVAALASD
ncbi:TetR/AcrR family transcriptional regulator [Microbacterium bovistercoris]|uniref:TetR/AcrR family transcriptional regulator n=1 Tax=Microbacterium bovistercoris TaxID=2293570 RepID=A0A371NY12_9MICO|nr:TetR/AcrR family transcriptional regulator [Microbacterium bovistercoris]REJ07696.1 TetR/AcrR family transcriptional regulator [Microbacterium bovistercoris]